MLLEYRNDGLVFSMDSDADTAMTIVGSLDVSGSDGYDAFLHIIKTVLVSTLGASVADHDACSS